MTRRVGFDTGKGRKKSVADRVMDEWRAKARAKADARSPQKSPAAQIDRAQDVRATKPAKRREWIPIIFITFWLAGWSTGIYFVVWEWIDSGDNGLLLWLTFALFGWVMAVVFLFILIRNK